MDNEIKLIPIIKDNETNLYIKPIDTQYTIDDIVIELDEGAKNYECIVCYGYLVKDLKCTHIFQCVYGHLLCLPCWEKVIELKKFCPQCRVPVSFKLLARNLFMEGELQEKLLINCPNGIESIMKRNGNNRNYKLCDKIFLLKDLQSHLSDCPFQLMNCYCSLIFQKQDIKYHQEKECTLITSVCQFCLKEDIPKFKLNQHFIQCEKFLDDYNVVKELNLNYENLKLKYEEASEKLLIFEKQSPVCQIQPSLKKEDMINSINNNNFIENNSIIDEYSNEWLLQNYSHASKFYDHKHEIKSKVFNIYGLNFQILLSPFGRPGSQGHLSVFLLLTNKDKKVRLVFSIHVVNYIQGQDVKKFLTLEYSGNGVGGFNKLLTSKFINKHSGFLKDDNLLIKFNIKILKITNIIKTRNNEKVEPFVSNILKK